MANKHIDARHQARKVALQALFEWSFYSQDITEILERDIVEYADFTNLEQKEEVSIDKELSHFIVKGVTDNLDEIDKIISDSAPEWPIDQIAKIDLEILRMSIFELYIAQNVPPKVAIDEAVELGKEFGGENSSKFINGVLGTVVKNLMPEVLKEEKKKTSKKKKA